jgi:hypothetical protein
VVFGCRHQLTGSLHEFNFDFYAFAEPERAFTLSRLLLGTNN